jgi:hypothetical protein
MSSRKVTKNFIAMIFSSSLFALSFLFSFFFLVHSLRFAFYALASIKIIFLFLFARFNISRVSSNKLSGRKAFSALVLLIALDIIQLTSRTSISFLTFEEEKSVGKSTTEKNR